MRRNIGSAHTHKEHRDGSDEGDCKANNTAGTDDEEEGNDIEDADDCDAAGESRKLRTVKCHKRFFCPKVNSWQSSKSS